MRPAKPNARISPANCPMLAPTSSTTSTSNRSSPSRSWRTPRFAALLRRPTPRESSRVRRFLLTGEASTSSLGPLARVLEATGVGTADAGAQRDPWPPAELRELGDVEQLARRPVGLAPVVHDLAVEA